MNKKAFATVATIIIIVMVVFVGIAGYFTVLRKAKTPASTQLPAVSKQFLSFPNSPKTKENSFADIGTFRQQTSSFKQNFLLRLAGAQTTGARLIVYENNLGGRRQNRQIFSYNLTNGEIKQLTNEGNNFQPIFSDINNKIAFLRPEDESGAKWSLHVLDLNNLEDGVIDSNVKRIVGGHAFSPDGNSIAYFANDGTQNPFLADDSRTLVIAKIDTLEKKTYQISGAGPIIWWPFIEEQKIFGLFHIGPDKAGTSHPAEHIFQLAVKNGKGEMTIFENSNTEKRAFSHIPESKELAYIFNDAVGPRNVLTNPGREYLVTKNIDNSQEQKIFLSDNPIPVINLLFNQTGKKAYLSEFIIREGELQPLHKIDELDRNSNQIRMIYSSIPKDPERPPLSLVGWGRSEKELIVTSGDAIYSLDITSGQINKLVSSIKPE